jgi:hypothetical protein
MSLLLVTWIPVVISGDTEMNGLICPDCVISLTSELLQIEYNKHKQRLFTYPYRITDVNSDILLIDRTSNDDGRVVVLGKEGDLKWIYLGWKYNPLI